MTKYILTIAATGTFTIEADNKEDAEQKFIEMDSAPLWEELRSNGIDMTDITEDE